MFALSSSLCPEGTLKFSEPIKAPAAGTEPDPVGSSLHGVRASHYLGQHPSLTGKSGVLI